MEKTIAVVSGKGGTGKTSFVSNVGFVLNVLLPKVTLLDADINTSNLGLSFGMYQLPFGLQDLLNGDIEVDDSVYIHPSGLRIIPSSISLSLIMKKTPLKKIREIVSQIGGLVIIDCPPGVDSGVTSLIKASDETIVVTNPQITAVTDSFKLITISREMGIEPKGIVVNRSRGKHEMSAADIESMCDCPVIASIPEDPAVDRGLFERMPAVYVSPLSPASLAYTSIAHSIVGMKYKPPKFVALRRMFLKKGK